MFSRLIHAATYCIGVFWSVGAFSQAADTPSLALHEVLERALVHSAQVRKARWEREATALRISEQRRSGWLPQAQLSASADYVPALPTTFLPATLFGGAEGAYTAATLGQPWQVFASVRVEQPLFDESARRLTTAATWVTALQDLLVQQSEEEVIFQTTNLFYQVLQTKALLKALDAHQRQLETLERTVRVQVSGGSAVPTDVQRVQVALAGLQARRQELESGIEALLQGIQFVCGIPFSQPIALVETRRDTVQWMAMPAVAADQTTTYRLLDGRLSLLRTQERSARAQGWPKLGLYAQAGILSQRTDARFAASEGRWYPLGLIGLRLDWPLLNGYRHRQQVSALRLEARKSEEEREYFTQLRQLEQLQARSQWENARRTLYVREQGVELARKLVGQTQLIFQENKASLSDLLAAQTALAEAETQYEQQVFTCRLAEVKWLKAAGQLRTLLDK